MEDVLDVYQRAYDPLCPVVCLDETNRQLIEKRCIPSKPGRPQREDYKYRRCGGFICRLRAIGVQKSGETD